MRRVLLLTIAALLVTELTPTAQRTVKPALHGRHWVAITGKPLGATAGAMIFQKGGNAVDAACAMLGAVSTMWDTLGWGGETQALIYNPKTKKVIGHQRARRRADRRDAGVLSPEGHAVPARVRAARRRHAGNARRPDGDARRVRHAEPRRRARARRSRWPTAIRSRPQAADAIERQKDEIKKWPYSKTVFLPHAGEAREAPRAGEIFKQADLAATLRKLVDAEQQALAAGKNRKDAIYAAYDRFYQGDIAQEFVRGSRELGGLHHDGGPRPLEGARRRAGQSPTTRASRSTS